MAQAIRILGIDPGLRRTGWGLIACEGNRLIYSNKTSSDVMMENELSRMLKDDFIKIFTHFRVRFPPFSHLLQQFERE